MLLLRRIGGVVNIHNLGSEIRQLTNGEIIFIVYRSSLNLIATLLCYAHSQRLALGEKHCQSRTIVVT